MLRQTLEFDRGLIGSAYAALLVLLAATTAYVNEDRTAYGFAQVCAIVYPMVLLVVWPYGSGPPGSGPVVSLVACVVIPLTCAKARSTAP